MFRRNSSGWGSAWPSLAYLDAWWATFGPVETRTIPLLWLWQTASQKQTAAKWCKPYQLVTSQKKTWCVFCSPVSLQSHKIRRLKRLKRFGTKVKTKKDIFRLIHDSSVFFAFFTLTWKRSRCWAAPESISQHPLTVQLHGNANNPGRTPGTVRTRSVTEWKNGAEQCTKVREMRHGARFL